MASQHATLLRDLLDEFYHADDGDNGQCAAAFELCARQRTTSDLRARNPAPRGKFTAAAGPPHPLAKPLPLSAPACLSDSANTPSSIGAIHLLSLGAVAWGIRAAERPAPAQW